MTRLQATAGRLGREEAHALAGLVALFLITAAWWALALWPVRAAPDWLERTRLVCFGIHESGLPDGGGWVGLIGGPAGMGLILVFGWANGLRGLLQRARASRTVAATLTALALGAVLLVTGAAVRVHNARVTPDWAAPDPTLPPLTYPRLDRPAPALALTAHTGQPLDLAQLAGRPVLITFAYAHCETVCPLIVQQALRAQAELRDEADTPALVIVTLDPWRDTPSRLAAMATAWGLPEGDAWVVGGTVEDVERTLDAWEVPRSRDATTGEITHPSLLYIVDRAGRLAYVSTGGAAAIAELLRRL